MKRISVFIALLAALATFAIASTASAESNNPQDCGKGKLVVNVMYNLYNNYDSGVAGNAWANDTINRHLQVWQVDAGVYCVAVNDNGSFVTFAGLSPNNTGTVSAGIEGVINGGYYTNAFSGTLDPSPAYATRGYLGSFDLECSNAYTCTGTWPSFLDYFNGSPSYDLADWGWTYHTAQNGDWVNAASGNLGDIIG